MNRVEISVGTAATPSRPKPDFFAIVDLLIGPVTRLEAWRKGHKARQQFARIEARTLRDAGIDEAQRFILSQPRSGGAGLTTRASGPETGPGMIQLPLTQKNAEQ